MQYFTWLRGPSLVASILIFHRDYAKFGERVHEYWYGPGVYPILEKLKELADKRDTNEYKFYKKRLARVI